MRRADGWGLALVLLICGPATAGAADVDLAILARDRGRHDEALSAWVKASLQPDARGFVWNQLGWAYAALRRLPEARDSFLRGTDRSATTADRAESQLGLAVTALMSAQPRQALAPLRALLEQNPFDQTSALKSPYVMAAANYEAAQAATSLGDKVRAMAYLRQCASLDDRNLECLQDLAGLQANDGKDREAWYSYKNLLDRDPADPRAARESKRLRPSLKGDSESELRIRRIERPMLGPQPAADEALPEPGPALRVGLFTAPGGRPAAAARIYFTANSDFKVLALSGEVIQDGGKALRRWEVDFRPEHDLVELRDDSRNIVHTTTQSFRIVPGGPAASVLLSGARFADGAGFDQGDREVRGAVEVRPATGGFQLINVVGLEEYLYGVVSAALPLQSDSEAYKAQAVVSRSRALWFKAHAGGNPERADICDSEACQKYLGLSAEMRDAAAAVRATAGITLTKDGTAALALEHDDCGGVTEDGRAAQEPGAEAMVSVSDGEHPAAIGDSPEKLELWTHEYPGPDRYCEATGTTAPAESRWMRIIPAADITERAKRSRDIGPVRQLLVRARTATGRVRVLEVVGSRGSLTLEGAQAMASVLSPGSLRSTLFTVQPLMAGAQADRFIIWGAGTGHGVGLCRAGMLGQARLGRRWPDILAHYFPALKLTGLSESGKKKPQP
ncbi:MAG: SpoIID/LytB domain-containing protein [Elusimicrobia bacterium]|nr:SpoIID/LytB domain-containing protein [Elusimicrobiota bacterium]